MQHIRPVRAMNLAAVAVMVVLGLACSRAAAVSGTPTGCCMPTAFQIGQSKVTIPPGPMGVSGDVLGTFAVDTVAKKAFVNGSNWAGDGLTRYFREGKGYAISTAEPSKCISFPLPPVILDHASFCVGAESDIYKLYSGQLALGDGSLADVWTSATGPKGQYIVVQHAEGSPGKCVPVAEINAESTAPEYGFTTSFNRSVFELPAVCTNSSTVEHATLEEVNRRHGSQASTARGSHQGLLGARPLTAGLPAPPGCCMPLLFQLNSTLANTERDSLFADYNGSMTRTVAVDFKGEAAFIQYTPFQQPNSSVQMWAMGGAKQLLYFTTPELDFCLNSTLPKGFFDHQAVCTGDLAGSVGFTQFGNNVTFGTDVSTQVWFRPTDQLALARTGGTCVPVASESSHSTALYYGYNQSPNTRLFDLPSKCSRSNGEAHARTLQRRAHPGVARLAVSQVPALELVTHALQRASVMPGSALLLG